MTDGHRERDLLSYRRRQTEAFLNLGRILRALDRLTIEAFENEGISDVTPAQANALMILFQARGSMTARQLAKQMSLSEVTVGRFVHALEKAGWVERRRSKSDRRAYLLVPTAQAYDNLPGFIRVSNVLLDRAFAGLDDESFVRLTTGVDRVRANLDGSRETPDADDPAS